MRSCWCTTIVQLITEGVILSNNKMLPSTQHSKPFVTVTPPSESWARKKGSHGKPLYSQWLFTNTTISLSRVGEYAYHLSDAVQCITNRLVLQTIDKVG